MGGSLMFEEVEKLFAAGGEGRFGEGERV